MPAAALVVAAALGGGSDRGRAAAALPGIIVRFERQSARRCADAWGIPLGEYMDIAGLGPQRVVGFAQAPDNVSFPLSKPRFYLSRAALDARFGAELDPQVDLAQIWLRDRRYLDEVLVQA